jgi:hypothetical protein
MMPDSVSHSLDHNGGVGSGGNSLGLCCGVVNCPYVYKKKIINKKEKKILLTKEII